MPNLSSFKTKHYGHGVSKIVVYVRPYRLIVFMTQRRVRVANIPTSYPGSPELKSRPGDQLI
jgi:hypothetical protein